MYRGLIGVVRIMPVNEPFGEKFKCSILVKML